MKVKRDGSDLSIFLDGCSDVEEAGAILIDAAIWQTEVIKANLQTLDKAGRFTSHAGILSVMPWVDRLGRTVQLLENITE